MDCSECKWYYLASALDGTGGLSLGLNSYGQPFVRLTVRSRSAQWLHYLRNMFPEFTQPMKMGKNSLSHEMCVIKVADVVKLLSGLEGKLFTLRERAEVSLRYCKSRAQHPHYPLLMNELQMLRNFKQVSRPRQVIMVDSKCS
jgi:hypothetical protein